MRTPSFAIASAMGSSFGSKVSNFSDISAHLCSANDIEAGNPQNIFANLLTHAQRPPATTPRCGRRAQWVHQATPGYRLPGVTLSGGAPRCRQPSAHGCEQGLERY